MTRRRLVWRPESVLDLGLAGVSLYILVRWGYYSWLAAGIGFAVGLFAREV